MPIFPHPSDGPRFFLWEGDVVPLIPVRIGPEERLFFI